MNCKDTKRRSELQFSTHTISNDQYINPIHPIGNSLLKKGKPCTKFTMTSSKTSIQNPELMGILWAHTYGRYRVYSGTQRHGSSPFTYWQSDAVDPPILSR